MLLGMLQDELVLERLDQMLITKYFSFEEVFIAKTTHRLFRFQSIQVGKRLVLIWSHLWQEDGKNVCKKFIKRASKMVLIGTVILKFRSTFGQICLLHHGSALCFGSLTSSLGFRCLYIMRSI